jgi:hypothetical protein
MIAAAILGICLLLLMATPLAAAPAIEAEVESELTLYPVRPPGFIVLQAGVVEVTIHCDEGRGGVGGGGGG